MFLGVGWGNNVHVLAHSHDVTPRHVHLHVRTYVMLRWRCWPHLDVRSHMAVAMGGKCSWKSPVGENRCVLSEDVEITGKNGCRWGFGHADFPKGTFFALRHVNYIQYIPMKIQNHNRIDLHGQHKNMKKHCETHDWLLASHMKMLFLLGPFPTRRVEYLPWTIVKSQKYLNWTLYFSGGPILSCSYVSF